mmetsp:Transcript_10837/g.18330  ORF Transcript_10837/g.18330 Transcript_10837/m.18330 type:complete len:309 (-) Transcript_10837:1499-2425(-)
MTSWPWMQDVAIAIADPVDAVNQYDERPSVKDLISRHRTQIDDLREELEGDALYDREKHDDLWLLRFVLSHRNSKPGSAGKAAKNTLAFRDEHGLDDHDIRAYPVTGPETHPRAAPLKEYLKYCTEDAINYCVPDGNRGVIAYLRLAGIDQHKLVSHLPDEMWLTSFLYSAEWTHQWLDYVTRTTGRLTKSIRIMDTCGVSLHTLNRDHTKRYGKVMAALEDCYPQLLHGIYVCKSSVWIQTPWRMVRPLLPKRLVEKIDFLSPDKNPKELQRLLKFVSEEHLAARFGGRNTTWPTIFPAPPTQHDIQ